MRRLVVPILCGALVVAAAATWGALRSNRGRTSAADDPDRDACVVRVDAAGRVLVNAPGESPVDVGTLRESSQRARETLDRLRDVLARATAPPVPRDRDDGSSTLALALRATPSAPWPEVAWIMQAAADAHVKIRHIRLVDDRDPGNAVALDLPLPAFGGYPDLEPRPVIRVVLTRAEAATRATVSVFADARPEEGPDEAARTPPLAAIESPTLAELRAVLA